MASGTGGIVTLLTDFGHSDWYVGAMKGVLLARCPHCQLVDITHDIPPGDICAASWVLLGAYPFFPERTVHTVVVDPGVGGGRRPLLVEAGGHRFVGPDNGVLDPVIQQEGGGVVRVLIRDDLFLQPLSRTFHGRDVFAPVAAFLCGGGAPESLGPQVGDWVKGGLPEPRGQGEMMTGLVVHVDRFGNGMTNLRMRDLQRLAGEGEPELLVGDHRLVGIRGTYSEAPPGVPLLLEGSSGFLEIAVNRGSAAALLGLQAGRTEVRLRKSGRRGDSSCA
jgi:hypothetical protein